MNRLKLERGQPCLRERWFAGRSAPAPIAWLAAFALVVLAVPSAASVETNSVVTASRSLSAAPYLRVHKPGANVVELQIAIRKFIPAGTNGPAVWLTGVSHIGDTNYYQALQRHLEDRSLVLFEGVGRGDEMATGTVAEKKPFQPGQKSETASLQTVIANSLGLAFQLEAMDYDRPHFRNSDLSVEEIRELMRRGEEGGAPNQEFDRLVRLMEGSSFMGGFVMASLKLIGSNPKFQAMTKLMLIETLGAIEGDPGRVQGLPDGLKRLLEVLIEARNETVIRDLKRELAKMEPVGSISVFYGAGHMPDLEKRLVDELGYRAVEGTWLPAFSVNPVESGLSELELQLMRALIKTQLEQLKLDVR